MLDVPFAPSVFNRGKVLPMRDNEGYIRLFEAAACPSTTTSLPSTASA